MKIFRAWDKEKRKFYEEVHRGYEGVIKEILLASNGDVILHELEEGKERLVVATTRFEIDRWTGKADMNGKGIYENDIVVWGHHCKWCREPLKITVVKMSPDIEFHELRTGGIFIYGCFEHPLRNTTHLEVVGNIRENPEILEDPEGFLRKWRYKV